MGNSTWVCEKTSNAGFLYAAPRKSAIRREMKRPWGNEEAGDWKTKSQEMKRQYSARRFEGRGLRKLRGVETEI